MTVLHLAVRRLAGSLLLLGLFAVPALAYASVSVSIGSVSPSTSVSVGTTVSFNVAATGFTNPTYSVSDSFNGTSVTSGDINSSGGFSWDPTNNDVGTHTLTVTVSDSLGDNATAQETITVSPTPAVSISSLWPSSSISVGQTVSFSVNTVGFSNPTYSISDSFLASDISDSNINSSGGFSWTPPNSAQDGTHTITVTVTDSQGHSASASETISVQSAPTVVIQSLSPGSTVSAGQTVTFSAAASNFSSPSYSLSDSFGGSSVTNADINSSGDFSWTPTQNDDGTHTITVTVVDGSGHTATASQTITVQSISAGYGTNASIQGLSPGSTVVVGQPVTFTVAATNFTNPVFSIGDSFGAGSSISNSDINSAGYFSWTPTQSDIGTHNLIVYVNSAGQSGNVTISLVVEAPTISITSVDPGTDVLPNSPLTFVVSPVGFTNPSYTVSDSFSGTSVSDSDINSSGDFSWTPASNQEGTHTITVYATDSYGHSANTSITIDVSSGTSVELSAPTPSASIAPGAAVSFNAYAYGFTNPTFTVQDSFSGSSVTNSAINSSGEFYWIPTANDVGTHTITITATDAYGHFGSAQVTITVAGSGTTLSGSSLSELEALLQQDETEITSLGGTSSTVATSYVFSGSMSPGMTSNEVTQLQTVLEQQGDFSGPVTGYYGVLTTAAVEEFQGQHDISQVGVVGPETLAALNALMVPEGTTTTSSSSATVGDGYVFENFIGYGDTGTDVTELQKRLTAFGVYSGPVTGYFGSLTQAAVETFQGDHGIEQVGYVGPATRAALNQ